jgi:hypothetical protein
MHNPLGNGVAALRERAADKYEHKEMERRVRDRLYEKFKFDLRRVDERLVAFIDDPALDDKTCEFRDRSGGGWGGGMGNA